MFRHLHIVACSPRSGTTLLHEAMVTCFQVDRHYEHEMRFNLASAAASARAMNEVRPIGPDSVGLWRRSLGRIKAQQQLHGSLTPDLVDCGYEASAEWEGVLEGVEPDFAASRYAERIYFWRRLAARVDGWRKVAAYRRMRRRQAPA